MRQLCLGIAAGLAASVLAVGHAADAPFPDHPVKIVIGFPPGSATDVATRIIANKMGDLLGQPMVVENKPGASTNIAAAQVARAAPDGYTLFMAGNSNSVNPALLKNVPVDMFRDFTPVGLAATVPSILVVAPSLGVTSVPDLIAAAKRTPGKIFFASSGVATTSHLSGELFGMSTGAKMTHVPYKGSNQVITDLLAGSVPVMFAPAPTVLAFVKDNKLTALATTGLARSRLLPDLPTVAEAGVKDYETRIWFGLVAPAGTPQPVVQKLSSALDAATDSQEVRDQLAAQGIEPFKGDAKEFARYMQQETRKWADVIKTSGITVE
ncbi:Bug family tripartite tricarboxylate transporter substrate binding protein [Pigmentiphaga litoralis]|uniref:Tripartite-type tricarboxylate transporter receptor subunit TctC n=1 Tax=Pigmentiphaga litoralis TaxID=516702 RepID=A0A7Y9IWN0_9BURK|nr:tripartite tricarboxylate transporter substrate binding protein [Pigmentiphaga litoralis]NYE22210.1 tripartite-type tricarboxylate transporter receptor subunit TctC [Pigmentiphaga litoralis]NYE84175.1 tripartite-type tricarboxylate transporter receptor subunit TctC [Pigmentiphaga litoralis]